MKWFRLGLLSLVIVMCLKARCGSCFNLDMDSKMVYQRRERGQWFGFSVALHKAGQDSWILVGAPRANTDQPGVHRGGSVYKCNPYRQRDCRPVLFDIEGHNYELDDGVRKRTDNKSEQWFGATVATGGINQPVVACAPRYIYFSKNYERREPVGTCYVSDPQLNRFKEYAPCRTSAWGRHRQGWCQAGLSAAISKNGEHLFIGAVGSWQWQGQVFTQNLKTPSSPVGTKEGPVSLDVTYQGYSTAVGEFSGDNYDDVVVGRPRGSNITGEILIYNFELEELEQISGEQIGSYFGYSIAVVDINNDKLHDIIVGAPLYNDYEAKGDSYESGRIYIFYQTHEHAFEREKIDGKHSKGRFGLSVASLTDINLDDYGDIAVGAPYEGNGAVYIFHGTKNGIKKTPSQVIHAKEVNRNIRTFGFSISGALDIDSNGYPDLAVGGYESDSAVFFRSRPVVTILPEITISPENIHLETRLCNLRDGTPVSCVEISICFNFTGRVPYNEVDASYEMILDAESRVKRLFFKERENENAINVQVRLFKNKLECYKQKAYVHDKIYDKLSPITVKVEPKLMDYTRSKRQISSLKPILNQNVKNVARKKILILNNCGGDQKCTPDLKLKVSTNVDEHVIKKEENKIEFRVEITNDAENAYDAHFYMEFSDLVDYNSVSKNHDSLCDAPTERKNYLTCFLGNPLGPEEKVSFTVYVTPKTITRKASDFVFRLTANSSNPESNSTIADNEHIVVIPVYVNANLTVYGQSFPETVSYNVSTYNKIKKKTSEADLGPEIIHTYTIKKIGPSSILKAEVIILWPSDTLSNKPIMYLTRPPVVTKNVKCEQVPVDPQNLNLNLVDSNIDDVKFTKSVYTNVNGVQVRNRREVKSYDKSAYADEMDCGNAICTKINCTITNLKNEEIIMVAGRLWVSTVQDLGLSKIGVQSKVLVRVTELPFQVNPEYLGYITDTVHTAIDSREEPPERRPIPWWIIAVAACVGLLLLIIIVLILWKLGFFERKKHIEERIMKNEKNGYHSPQPDDAYL